MRGLLNNLVRVLVVAIAVLSAGCSRAYLPSLEVNPWQAISLPTEATLSDIAFTGDPQHGWLVGKNATLLETKDGGETWEERQVSLDDDQIYTFTSVSFSGNEGWIVGEPSILLHTNDGGTSWSRIPLSEKLPGSPDTIIALGKESAEMTTDVGAIYQTKDGGRTWKAMVQEAVGVLRNIARSPEGGYVAVSARGNFYSTWEPGQDAWVQHNRTSSRRLQNMGYAPNGKLWLLARGGIVQFSEPNSLEDWQEQFSPEFSTSWGLLDLAYRTEEEVWVAGGSGNLLMSTDGGETWQKDRDVENIPSNFYRIVFLDDEHGFILGQGSTMLRYISPEEAA
ncbi:MAG: photosynthesis system II assembly factor Ycf48 [Cyanobacteria bacterium J06638_20]